MPGRPAVLAAGCAPPALVLLLTLVLLAGCAAARKPVDGPPSYAVDISAIPDAVPRPEARSPYGNPPFYEVDGRRYHTLPSASGYAERGIASWYGTAFHGQRTSSGEPYDMLAMTAAHRTLPLPSFVEVTHLGNGRKVVVRVNDRGPFRAGRIIDLSYAAAVRLGIAEQGTAPVALRAIVPSGEPQGPGRTYLQVGAFSDPGNAERLRARLAETELPAPQVRPTRLARGTVYRVRIGPLPGRAEAERLRPVLARLGLHDLRVVVD
jgi:rare lipoprotein A